MSDLSLTDKIFSDYKQASPNRLKVRGNDGRLGIIRAVGINEVFVTWYPIPALSSAKAERINSNDITIIGVENVVTKKGKFLTF